MLSERFEPKLMKIGRIELDLFKLQNWTYTKKTPCIFKIHDLFQNIFKIHDLFQNIFMNY